MRHTSWAYGYNFPLKSRCDPCGQPAVSARVRSGCKFEAGSPLTLTAISTEFKDHQYTSIEASLTCIQGHRTTSRTTDSTTCLCAPVSRSDEGLPSYTGFGLSQGQQLECGQASEWAISPVAAVPAQPEAPAVSTFISTLYVQNLNEGIRIPGRL